MPPKAPKLPTEEQLRDMLVSDLKEFLEQNNVKINSIPTSGKTPNRPTKGDYLKRALELREELKQTLRDHEMHQKAWTGTASGAASHPTTPRSKDKDKDKLASTSKYASASKKRGVETEPVSSQRTSRRVTEKRSSATGDLAKSPAPPVNRHGLARDKGKDKDIKEQKKEKVMRKIYMAVFIMLMVIFFLGGLVSLYGSNRLAK